MIRHRVTAEFDLEIQDEAEARLLAANVVHSLAADEADHGRRVQGDADAVLDSPNVVVSMIVQQILARGVSDFPWANINKVKLHNDSSS